jgi:hypothetical protein
VNFQASEQQKLLSNLRESVKELLQFIWLWRRAKGRSVLLSLNSDLKHYAPRGESNFASLGERKNAK